MPLEGVTDELMDRLRSVGVERDDILCTFRSDLDRAGGTGSECVVVTSRDIVVAGSDHRSRGSSHLLREALEGSRIEPAIGSVFLQVRSGGNWQDLARCTNRLRDEAANLAERLDHWIRLGEFPLGGPAIEERSLPKSQWSSAGSRRHQRTLARVWELIRPYRWTALLLALLSLSVVGIGLVPPILEKLLVDRVLDVKGPVTRTENLLLLLAAIVGGLLCVRVATALIAVWKGRVAARVGAALTAHLRTRLVRKLHELPIAYHDRNQVGMLMSRVAYDTEVMHTLVHQTSGGFLLQLLQLVGIGVMLFWLNPTLAFYTMLPMPLVIGASWYFSRFLHPRHHHYWEAVGKQAAALTGMLSGIRVVKSFTQEEREFERFREASERLRDSRKNVDSSTAVFAALVTFLFAVGQLIVWYVGGRQVLAGEMTLGSLMAFLAYLWMFNAPLQTLAESTTWISNFLTASQRIFELIDTANDIADPEPAARPEPAGAVRFEHVTFGYGDGEPVLKEIEFEIRPGEMIGIVGRSGSGKSTLVSLIGRMYDSKSGRVLVDGADVREMGRQDLRRRIGIVLQDPFLFRGSLAANIVYGRPEASPEQILKAARAAYAHEFVMRAPFAYDSQVGEGGAGLSGGERQRISIARALLYDPRILILDEATSSVDTESERAIQEALRDYAKGRTTIAIAHRLSTLRDADRLLVFDRGRLVEQGMHDELLARGGLYSSLVNIQSNVRRGVLQLQTAGGVDGDGGSPHDAVTLDMGADAALFGIDAPDESGGDVTAGRDVRWLDPSDAVIGWEEPTGLRLEEDGAVLHGLKAFYCFPASHPEGFISLRRPDPLGGDAEVGMIHVLSEWPSAAQDAVRRALGRRYLMRRITEVRGVRTAGDRLDCAVETEEGPTSFRLDPRGDAVQAYGRNGRLLVDVDQNYYVIPDLDALPRRQRRMLALYLGI